MRITIELSPDSVRKAVDILEKRKSEYDRKMDEVCRRLAEIGAQEAILRMQFAGAYGNTDVGISTEKMDNGYKIVMSGADIYFVEFGTGDYVDYPDAPDVSVGVYPGSYSEGHANQYSTKGYWYYDNIKYYGTPAEMPMYYAGKAVRENEKKVFREVFGK